MPGVPGSCEVSGLGWALLQSLRPLLLVSFWLLAPALSWCAFRKGTKP